MADVHTLQTPTAPRRDPWLIALGAAAALVVGNGPLGVIAFGVFIKPIEQQMGWDRAHLSAAPALAALVSAVCVPVVGALMDRVGVKRVLLPAILAFAVNLAAVSLAGSYVAFMALVALTGITGAAQGPIGYQKSIAHFFHRNRGLATGLAMSGVGIGAGLIPPFAQFLVVRFGWRAGYLGLAGVLLAIALPAVIWCVREPGALPSGRAAPQDGLPGVTVREAFGTRAFWILAIVVFSVSTVVNGSIVHTVPLLIDRGFSPAHAASMMGAVGLSTIAGRLLTGFLLDRVFAPHLAAAVFLAAAGGLLLLANPVAPIVGVVSLGFATGAEINLIGYMAPRHFGMKRFGQLYGYLFSAFTIGSGLGPFLMGLVYSQDHSYGRAFVGFEATLIAASLLILFVGRSPEPTPLGAP